METIIIKAAQLFLSLSLLVLVHEFGHFLFAKLFKIRVEKFYLFFNPWFSLFKYKPKNSDTTYGIGWLPLGGYVKISGMIDESMDTEQMKKPPQPWEFRSKPIWQRLLVMVGGVLFNFILAWFIFSMMVFSWGDSYYKYSDSKKGMMFSEVAKDVGFQDGDILLSADGEEFHVRFGILGLSSQMAFIDGHQIEIMRGGEKKKIGLPDNFPERIIASNAPAFMPMISPIVDSVLPNSEAKRMGMMAKDSIIAIDSVPVYAFQTVANRIKETGAKLKGDSTQTLEITVMRNGEAHQLMAKIDTVGALGFYVNASMMPDTIYTDEYGFFGSLPMGAKFGKELLMSYVAQARFIFSSEGAKNLSGFAGIGSMFPPKWDWYSFWVMTAFLSLALGFMNILPIPMLDGGHIVFLLYEGITGRPPNEKFQEFAQLVGFMLVIGLILLANGNDLIRFLFK